MNVYSEISEQWYKWSMVESEFKMKEDQMNSNRVLLSAILVALLIPTLSLAEANISLNGVGGRLGFVMPEDPIDNTIGLGFVVREHWKKAAPSYHEWAFK